MQWISRGGYKLHTIRSYSITYCGLYGGNGTVVEDVNEENKCKNCVVAMHAQYVRLSNDTCKN